MISKKSTFFLGIFIFIIPFLGFPSSWKTALVMMSAVYLMFLSVKITLPKKATRGRVRREKTTPVFSESIPVYPSNDTVERSGAKQEDIYIEKQ